MLRNWVLGSRKKKTGEGSGRFWRRGERGQGERVGHGAPIGVLEGQKRWLEGAHRRRTGGGDGGERRRKCSSRGTAARSGGLASRDQSEAS